MIGYQISIECCSFLLLSLIWLELGYRNLFLPFPNDITFSNFSNKKSQRKDIKIPQFSHFFPFVLFERSKRNHVIQFSSQAQTKKNTFALIGLIQIIRKKTRFCNNFTFSKMLYSFFFYFAHHTNRKEMAIESKKEIVISGGVVGQCNAPAKPLLPGFLHDSLFFTFFMRKRRSLFYVISLWFFFWIALCNF